MTMQQLSSSQSSPEVPINENFVTLEHQAVYGVRQPATSGLTWGYYGGRWGGFSVADGTFSLAAASTNYIVVAVSTGAATCSDDSTNWDDVVNYVRVYKVTTDASLVTAIEDHRAGPGGVHGGTGTGGAGGGGASGLEFVASTTTTDSDPGTGTIRWNNATQASATFLYIDNNDVDSTSVATIWANLLSGSLVTIVTAANADVWQLWRMTSAPTNGTGYYKFAVTLEAQEGSNISNGAQVRISVDAAAAPLADGDKGDITVSSSGATWTIDSDVVTYAKMQNVSATSRVLGRKTSGSGDPEECTLSEVLDFIGSAAQGDILYRGSSAWARLAAGTAKFMLQAAGASANPAWVAPRQVIPIACGDETTTAITAGTAKVTFRMPYAFKVLEVRASLTTAQASGSIFTVDINESGTTIISTKLTIDNTEKTSTTAATPAVISDADLADDAEITIDVDQVGTSGATGLKVYLIGYPAT